MNDEELSTIHVRIIAGDASALSEFEAALRPIVIGYLRNKGLNQEDADEVWNDAFLVAVDRAPTLEPIGVGLRKFVLRVAHNAGVDRIRRAVARHEVPLHEADGASRRPVSPPNPKRIEAVRRCLEAARPAYAAVVEMTARGLTAKEMASVLDKSEASVAKMRSRAIAWFAECLQGDIYV